jgi:TolB-like protein
VSDALFPALNLPDWTTRLVAGLVLLGFPVALIMAWMFEVTPEGVRRDTGSPAGGESSSRRLDIATLIGVAIVVVLVAWQKFDSTPGAQLDNSEIVTTTSAPSLAVLAFENMSPDAENAYFAEGISEEILNVLAGVNGLKVASRTSAFSFADTNTPIPEIASQLSVNHVLEGSVRKQGMHVRITAQLIDATNDKHLWSETYNRELDDIFVVQEEIAQAISKALLGALGMTEITVAAPTKDMVAYELFLSGRKHFYMRGQALKRAEIDLRAAVARDPDFAEAWSYLAAVQLTMPGYFDLDTAALETYTTGAAEAAAKALELDPGQALAVAIQGSILYRTDRLGGMALCDQAVAMAPNDAGLKMWAADRRYDVGYLSEALPLFERAYELDPLSGINVGLLGAAYLAAGRRQEGRELILRGEELGWTGVRDTYVRDLVHTGEIDAAIEFVDAWIDENTGQSREVKDRIKAASAQEVRREISSDELWLLAREINPDISEDNLLIDLLNTGDVGRFFDIWLKAPPDASTYLTRLVFTPSGKELVEHPKFIDVANRFGLMAVWNAKGLPFDCEMVVDDRGQHLSCPNWPD